MKRNANKLAWLSVPALALLALLLSLPAGAQNQSPCRADVERLCSDVEPGEGRIMACLRENKSEVSRACKTHMKERREEMRARAEQIRNACREDSKKFCDGVLPGRGRIVQCLKQNQAEVSEPCQEALQFRGAQDDI